MVYDTYNNSIHGGYKATHTHRCGGPHGRDLLLRLRHSQMAQHPTCRCFTPGVSIRSITRSIETTSNKDGDFPAYSHLGIHRKIDQKK